MLSFLKKHPFAVQAFFDTSTVLTYAVPKEDIRDMIPRCLELDTFNDQYAFIAIALVQTKNLRPKGFPAFMGNDFFLIGYRVFVKYINNAGKRLRGLYILKSETDKTKMEFLGNLFTNYQYTTVDINLMKTNEIVTISSAKSGFSVTLDTSENADVALPVGSPFADWKQARRFAGPLPFTFTFYPETSEVLIVEGLRENWTPRPVTVRNQQFSFLDNLLFPDIRLASAFEISNIPYQWKKGKVEEWKA
jgi:hypothetical protein